MKRLLALAAVLAAAPVSVPEPATARVVQREWTKIVSRTPAGAFVTGNPNAKVKLVEYLSLTCGHCADFTEQAWPKLKADYIAKGLVSLEVRHAVRDGFDLTGSLLARCTGPKGYFAATEAVLTNQNEWAPRAESFSGEKLEEMPLNARLMAMAKGSGLDRLFAARGMPPQRIAACLSDSREQKMLTAMTEEAWRTRKIDGTPAFLINDVLQPGVTSWAELEPRLAAVLK